MDDSDNLIWHTQVPLKVSILTWCLLRDRLPSKINLLNLALYLPQTPIVRRVVDRSKAHNICLFTAIILASFGSKFDFGLVLQVLIITAFVHIFFQFTNYLGGTRARDHFYSYYGFFVFG